MGATRVWVPLEDRRGHLIPQRQVTGHCDPTGRAAGSRFLEEQQALLNSEPKLYRPCEIFFK